MHPAKRGLGIKVLVSHFVTSSAKVDQQFYYQNHCLVHHEGLHLLEQRIVCARLKDDKHEEGDKQLGEEVFAQFASTQNLSFRI